MLKKQTLKGKTLIITGANRGIGFEMSKYFLKRLYINSYWKK